MKTQPTICVMTLVGLFLTSSVSGFSLLGPFKTIVPPAPPSSVIGAYLRGYREGWNLGYNECGPCTADYRGPFAEAFIRGQRTGSTHGWIVGAAERRGQQERFEWKRPLKLIWHPPMLPQAEDSHPASTDLMQPLLPSVHFDESETTEDLK